MYELKDKEVLFKVSKYVLKREGGRFKIDVLQVISGQSRNRFIAVPNLSLQSAEDGYWGVGSTEEDALRDCLRKIRDVSNRSLFPKHVLRLPDRTYSPAGNTKDE